MEFPKGKGADRATNEVEELAITIHSATCNWNHTDGCGWYYETVDGEATWTRWGHQRALIKASKMRELLPDLSVEQIISVMVLLREV